MPVFIFEKMAGKQKAYKERAERELTVLRKRMQ